MILGISIILNTFYLKGEAVPDDAGMAALFLNWIPFFIGLMTIILIFIVSTDDPKTELDNIYFRNRT